MACHNPESPSLVTPHAYFTSPYSQQPSFLCNGLSYLWSVSVTGIWSHPPTGRCGRPLLSLLNPSVQASAQLEGQFMLFINSRSEPAIIVLSPSIHPCHKVLILLQSRTFFAPQPLCTFIEGDLHFYGEAVTGSRVLVWLTIGGSGRRARIHIRPGRWNRRRQYKRRGHRHR